MQRRSNPRRGTRKRYTDDAFDGIDGIDELDAADDDESDLRRSRQKEGSEHYQTSDEGFSAVASDESDHEALESDIDDSDGYDHEIEPGNTLTDEDRDGDELDADPAAVENVPIQLRRPKDLKVKIVANQERPFDTIIALLGNVLYREQKLRTLYGPLSEDCEVIRDTIARWAEFPVLPPRTSVSNGSIGLTPSASRSDNIHSQEIASAWTWYEHEGGRQAFKQRQKLSTIKTAEGKKFLSSPSPIRQSLVYGSINSKSRVAFTSVEAGRAFATIDDPGTAQKPRQCPSDRGFIMYLGARVQSLAWIPNQPSHTQFLTIVLLDGEGDSTMLDASAFHSRPPAPSSIQIWSVSANQDGLIDTTKDPQLHLVLCTLWGQVKDLKWCPVPSQTVNGLGLLAGIGGDGCLRVVDVPAQKTSRTTTYLHIEEAAITVQPPNTVFTCLSWLDSSHIALGCADGHLAVIDVASSLSSGNGNPRPSIYVSISSTYISAMDSCRPSHPHMLAVSSMDGLASMIDLRRIKCGLPAATAYPPRNRNGAARFVWNDFTQCALTVDDNSNVRTYPIRRFCKTIIAARAYSAATALCSSPLHPFMLLGTARGDMITFNPLPRQTHKKAATWQQRVLAHEWRSPTPDERIAAGQATAVGTENTTGSPNAAATDGHVAPEYVELIAESGLSRILSGFPAEATFFAGSKQESSQGNGATFTTIYEEKSAITALSWNPNRHVAGWAAAGMGDGMIRIQDLAL